jgi:hypothetical protein
LSPALWTSVGAAVGYAIRCAAARPETSQAGRQGLCLLSSDPASKRESQFMALIGSKAAVILMGCVLGAMFVIVLVLLVTRG